MDPEKFFRYRCILRHGTLRCLQSIESALKEHKVNVPKDTKTEKCSIEKAELIKEIKLQLLIKQTLSLPYLIKVFLLPYQNVRNRRVLANFKTMSISNFPMRRIRLKVILHNSECPRRIQSVVADHLPSSTQIRT